MSKKVAGAMILAGTFLVLAGSYGLYQAAQEETSPVFKREERSRSKPVDTNRVEYVFKRYEEKHREVRASLMDYAREVRQLLADKHRPADPSIPVALLTELQRLKTEKKLVKSWKQGTLPKEDYVSVMADSLMVMEYLTLMEAYGRALNELSRDPVVNGQTLKGAALFKEAASRFDTLFVPNRKMTSPLYDAKIVDVSPSALRLVPIASQILSQGESALEYRVQFFSKYARNIINKNQKYLNDVAPGGVADGTQMQRSLSSVEASVQ